MLMITSDFYEEIFSLVQSLTASQISEPMWHVFLALFEMFKREGVEYFTGLFTTFFDDSIQIYF